MIIKNLTRKSGTSQLIHYIFVKKENEVEETSDKKFSRKELGNLTVEYFKDKVNFEFETDCTSCANGDFVDEQMEKSIRFAKTHPLAKELIRREELTKLDIKDTTFFISNEYLIARHSLIERFYKLDAQCLEKKTMKEKPIREKQAERIIKHNLRSKSIAGYIKEFEKNESDRLHKRKDNVKMNHTILSFSNKDKKEINKEILKDLANKYVELRGKENLYIGTVHHDREHIHLHIAMSGTEYLTGKSNRISRHQFQSIKLSLDQYQRTKYPQLIHSLPDHAKSQNIFLTKESRIQQAKDNRQSKKESLLQFLATAFSSSKSKEDFLSKLNEVGYSSYYRFGKLTGVQLDDGLKFRFSRLGYDEKTLNKLDEKSKEHDALNELKELRERDSVERNERNQGSKEPESDQKDEREQKEHNTPYER